MAQKKVETVAQVSARDKEDRKFHMFVKVWGEIRKVSDVVMQIEDKEYHHLELALDDEEEERFYLTDKNMENLDKYKRGMMGTFTVRIDVEEGFKGKTKMVVTDFEADE